MLAFFFVEEGNPKLNWANISEAICPEMLVFWLVGLSNVVLYEYSDKSHNFTILIFMMSSL